MRAGVYSLGSFHVHWTGRKLLRKCVLKSYPLCGDTSVQSRLN
jgi:hypothetical protein